ncbi:ankyrin repeat family protein [Rhynchospora pubera]|uniref:Ankyrin repeat family protein n=1 Tax=Rhynchospora pubera TaxID=906938 RepID=A0AAV8FE26_9POAL|nr:ankyrin repeat family protein [Rhynchospora pubera]
MASSRFSEKVETLLEAVMSGNLLLLKKVAKGFNESKIKGMKDEMGLSALHLGAFYGKTEICQYLVDDLGFHVDFLTARGETPLCYAAMKGHTATAMYLINRGANPIASEKDGITPLHYAAQLGHVKLVKYLLSLGVPVDITFNYANGAPLLIAATSGQASTVEVLLQHHADVNGATSPDHTPLFSSVRAASLECTRLLIKAGADPNLKCPLGIAVQKGSIEIIKCLLEAGADPNLRNVCGWSPIETAVMCKRWDIVEMLFPLTSPLPEVHDWSVQGLLQYVNSNPFFQKHNKILEKMLADSKVKGADLFKKKEYLAAIEQYSTAIGADSKIGSGDAALYSNRSLCWHRVREGDLALKDALMAQRLKPEWPKAYYRVGAAFMLLEEYEHASIAFMDGLQLDPTNKELQKARREAVDCLRKSCFDEESE